MSTSFANQTANQNSTLLKHDLKSCYNALVWRLILTTPQSYAVGICIAMVTIPTIFINAALFIGLVRTKQPRNTSNMYIKLTAISGFLNGITGQPLYIILFTVYSSQRFCALEMAAMFAVQFNVHILGYTILLLAIDRYLWVLPDIQWCKSVKKWIISRSGSKILCFTTFCLSVLHGLSSTNFFGFKRVAALNIAMMLVNFTLAIGVYIAYGRLYFRIRKHCKELSTMDVLPSRRCDKSSSSKTKTPNYLHEFVKTIAAILVAGFICYFPFIVMDIWTGWHTFIAKDQAPQDIRFSYYLFVTPIFLYSTVNAIILLYRNNKACNYVTSVTLKHFHPTVFNSPSTTNSREHFMPRVKMPHKASPLKEKAACTSKV